MDWSNKSIADEVSAYVGQALDSNVMAGIASTQKYRRHQAEMAELKSKKPELYATQNDWAATRDWDRYVTSGVVGDMYRQGTYTPYTDVNKLISESLPMLKEYGVEVKYTNDGNPLLTRIDKHEVLTEQETSNFLNLILGDKGNTQLSIDGLYKYRNASDADIKSEYKTNLSNQIDSLKTQSRNFTVLQAGKVDSEKAVYQQAAQNYQEQANQLTEYVKNVDNLDRDSIASNMYVNNYKQKWSKLLSFDRATDWKIDDRNFQIAKRNDDLKQKEWERNFQENKFQVDQIWKQKDYQLDLAKAMSADGKISLDSNGNPIPQQSNSVSNSGITTTSNGTALEEEKSVLAEDVYSNYSQAWTDARDATRSYISNLKQTEKGQNILREHYGNLADGDVEKLVFAMMRGDKDSQLRLSGLRSVMNKDDLGRSALNAIDNSISAYRQKERMTPLLNDALKGITDITKTVMKADNIGGEFYGLSGKVIGKEGKLVDGTYIGKDFDNLNSQERLGAQIGAISNRLFAGKLPEAERSALTVLRKNLIAQIKDSSARSYYNNIEAEDKTSAWDSLTSQFSAAGQKARMGWNSLMKGIFNDDEDRQAYEDAKKTYEANTANARRYWGRAGSQIGDVFNTNYTFNDLASNDLTQNGTILPISKRDGYNQSADDAFKDKVSPALKILDQRLQDSNSFRLNNKTINLNTEDKNIKANYESWIKAQFDGEIQNNANVKVNVNSQDGTVTVTAPVKDGKEYEMITTAPLSFNELPQNLRNQLTINNNYDYDASANPNASTLYARGQVYSSDNRINQLYGDLEINPTESRASVETVERNIQNVIGQENYNKYKQEIDAIIKTPVDLIAHPVNGQYVMDIKSGNTILSRQIMGTNISEQKDLIAEQKDKIAVEKIVEYIKKNYNR